MTHKPGTKVITSGVVGEITGTARRGRADGYNVWGGGGLPHFHEAHSIRLAVVGDTVCATPARGGCYCPLVHTHAETLAALPRAEVTR